MERNQRSKLAFERAKVGVPPEIAYAAIFATKDEEINRSIESAGAGFVYCRASKRIASPVTYSDAILANIRSFQRRDVMPLLVPGVIACF